MTFATRLLPVAILIFAALAPLAAEEEGTFVPGQLIVQFTPGSDFSDLDETFSDFQVREVKSLSQQMRISLIDFDMAVPSHQALERISAHPAVLVAQFNHYVQPRLTTPNDASFGQQWSMNNTGQSGGMTDADIDAAEAWDITTGGLTIVGDTIVVAVIDQGFDLSHPDIDWYKNYAEIPGNGLDDDGNGYVDDFDGWNAYDSDGAVSQAIPNHGTHVSGTIGAKGDNGMGVAGVNWTVKILPISGSSSVESTVVESYSYVLAIRRQYDFTFGTEGAYVVSTNSSFGVNFGQPANFPIWCAMYDSMGKYGILSAGATINASVDVDADGDIPTACASEFLLSVTNTTDSDIKVSGAGFGATTIDLGAPGFNILSTIGGGYGNSSGTSMATPHVAGAVALLYSAGSIGFMALADGDADSAALAVRQMILDGVDPNLSLQGITVTGGRLNLFNSVNEMLNFASCSVPLSSSIKSVSCGGAADGFVDLILPGGTDHVNFSWSTGDTTEDILGLEGGIYRVTVSDTGGCGTIQQFVVPEPFELIVAFSNVVDVNGATTGSISVGGSGGNTDLLYSLDGGVDQTTGFFDQLSVGTYVVTISDSNGCSLDTTFVVDDLTSTPNLDVISSFLAFPNPAQSVLEIDIALARQVDEIEIRLMDQLGRNLRVERISSRGHMQYRAAFEVVDLASGLYYLSVFDGHELLLTRKISKL